MQQTEIELRQTKKSLEAHGIMTSERPLAGRVALVTGASRGIGRGIALAMAAAGAEVAMTYHRREAEAREAAQELEQMGAKPLVLQADVAQSNSVRQIVQRTLDHFGRIDVLVNNAGILEQKPFLTITEDEWDRILDVNLKGTFLCSQQVFPVMQQQGNGCIINMASSGGQLGGPLAVHYSASKAGVITLTRSLARIGAPAIRVNCISPGLIQTEMTEREIASEAGRAKIQQILLQRAGLVEEVAGAAVFLASDRASYITGQTINVNGGLYLG